MASGTKRTSVFLEEKQIDFLNRLAKKIEKESHEKMPCCKIVEVLTKTLTCIKKAKIRKCKSEEEIERELLKCFKKAAKELKGP